MRGRSGFKLLGRSNPSPALRAPSPAGREGNFLSLCIKPEMHHIAVGHNIVLAFEAELAGHFGSGLAVP